MRGKYRDCTEPPEPFIPNDGYRDVMSEVEIPRNDEDLALSLPPWATGIIAAAVGTIACLLVPEAWAIPAYGVWGVLMGAITAVDLRELRVPNKLVGAAALVMFPLLALATQADIAGTSFLRAVLGAFAGFGVYLVMNIIAPSAMGMGDVKLSFVIGGHLGFVSWTAWYWSIFLAFVGMAVIGLILMIARRAGRKTSLPFGPFMVLGALVTLAAVL